MSESPFCKYKNMFGKPNEGAHSVRFMNIAIVDVTATIVIAWLISYYWNYDIYIVLAVLFVLGIIAHHIFCVRTTVDKLLFPDK